MSCSCVSQGVLLGLGNPLLDISANVTHEFLQRYGLKENDQILADDKHANLFNDMIKEFKVDYIPGGATQNSIRVAQWMLGTRHATTFTGCIGLDEFGKILEDIVTKEGVRPLYRYDKEVKTGTCAVCITNGGRARSLVANLGAANSFCKDFLKSDDNWSVVEKAKFYYMAGYPLTVCPDAMLEVAEHAASQGKIFCLNLSAPFLCKFFKEPLYKLIPFTDYLFGNEAEFLAYAEENNIQSKDLKEIGLQVSNLPIVAKKGKRTVIITQGHMPTIVVQDGIVREFPILQIPHKDIVDTNGAGDAFVGGFLACLVNGSALEKCIDGGNFAARFIIRQSGVQLPEISTFAF